MQLGPLILLMMVMMTVYVCCFCKAFVVSKQGSIPMTQYPYPTSATTDTRIYKPPQPAKYDNADADDSLAPLNYSDATSRYPPDTSSPQVITSGSSFDDDPSAAKVRRPKKGKKGREAVAASEKEKEAMMYSSAASSGMSLCCLLIVQHNSVSCAAQW